MKNKSILSLLLTLFLFMISCKKDFEEINTNPNFFTTASDGSLFNATISSLQSGWNEQLYINNEILYKLTQQVAVPQVRFNNFTIGTEEIWSNYYKTLPNFRELEKRFIALDVTSNAVKNMMAMEKTVLAYKTFKVTDLFGDVPFFNAGYGFQDANSIHPVFDSQESIYKFLLNELQWAAENISPTDTSGEPIRSFIAFDKLFGGDMVKWQKFANSLRLRYAMRMVKREPALSGQIIKDIIENGKPTFGVTEFGQLINDPPNECAALWPSRLGYKNDSRSWSFNQAKELRMGSALWHHLSTNDNTNGSGIFDPRAYYFFETSNNNEWVPYPNDPPSNLLPDGGAPYDLNTRDSYYSIKGAGCNYSPVNYFLLADRNNIPEVLISGAEVIFLRAEAYFLGIGVAQDAGMAETAILDGVQSSVSFWSYVMDGSVLPYGTTFSSTISVPSSVNFISIQNNIDYYSGGEQELREIYTQYWIDLFMQPEEAFALARRTGKTPREGAPLDVYRLPIPPSEASFNEANWLSAIGSSGDNMNQKVWWMN